MSEPADPASAKCEPDPHGQAALTLVESLIHGLVERSVLNLVQAIDIMEVALEAQLAVAEDSSSASARRAADLLTHLIASLQTEARE